MGSSPSIESSWQTVEQSKSADQQAQAIEQFLELNREAGALSYQVKAKLRATNTKAPIDQAIWDKPQDYELTLTYGDKEYVFVPLSDKSLIPLFRE